MKSHEHKYIAGTIGDECGFCGLLKSTIESMEKIEIKHFGKAEPCSCDGEEYHQKENDCPKSSNQIWDEALIPMVELLPTPATGFTQERINSEIQDKINELVKAVNKLNRP